MQGGSHSQSRSMRTFKADADSTSRETTCAILLCRACAKMPSMHIVRETRPWSRRLRRRPGSARTRTRKVANPHPSAMSRLAYPQGQANPPSETILLAPYVFNATASSAVLWPCC